MTSTQADYLPPNEKVAAGTYVDIRGHKESREQGYPAGVADTEAKYARLVHDAQNIWLEHNRKLNHEHQVCACALCGDLRQLGVAP